MTRYCNKKNRRHSVAMTTKSVNTRSNHIMGCVLS